MKFLFLIILMPLISFLLLSLISNYLNKIQISIIGVTFIGISAILTLIIGYIFLKNRLFFYKQSLWEIVNINSLHINFSLYLDMLSLIMLFITTWVGFFIHIFSIWYMKNEKGYSRFFAYTNLFIANMILLILADNFILMFFGWEGVGVCSYLLIGFFYKKSSNGLSAIKTFLITRFSDIFLIIGIFFIFRTFNTLNFTEIFNVSTSSSIYYKAFYLKIISIMIIIGSLSKSVQFPLNTWLIDAMVGPTPVSALIHAATMVTAGIYLILRNNILFLMNNHILFLCSIIGAITILLSGYSALIQNNIKRILAYSTMSQIGYMFLALGINLWKAALFHVISHAFFKALLFLCVASIIFLCKNEQNILKMGGIKKYFPFIYYIFLFGAMSLISLPFITMSGFTKEKILYEIFMSKYNFLLIISFIGSIFTSLYTFRMIYKIFYGKSNIFFNKITNNVFIHNIPLIILTILSSFIGIIFLPIKKKFLLPSKLFILNNKNYFFLEIISILILINSYLLYIFYVKNNFLIKKIIKKYYYFNFINNFFLNGYYIDFFYKNLITNIFKKFLLLIKNDPISKIIDYFFIKFLKKIGYLLLTSENGYIRWYILSIYIGTIIILVYLTIFINNQYYFT
ncbi:NADH-quinone oxidoreductase subunit L [Enterobacteriaceae endosymbiont of Donacia cincticornis]|uniref:NADH-quinone oxidoreductase subunit L n=1 Tax=Enterobacteriaceae endosymbiont of Donacia cincticornis TaxID=2675773 RepID=UPI001448FB91|nr:NADH-quinone oxidoreductase subunit L [Enterobacteriaceae endosymbiont of Donacia cincticornis]QJC36232.1 NADH-quinone oxidoreductase subunit L [Enterobacteriaceae endosymbiont of Donacia cincticornis]